MPGINGADLEYKSFDGAAFKSVEGAPEGTAEMIVSVFNNVDRIGDIVVPGAFADTIANRRTPDGYPKMKGVLGHDWLQPIAKTLDAKELLPGDATLPPTLINLGGLYIKGQFNLDTQRGREAWSDLKFGALDEFSFGFEVKEDSYDRETNQRKLLRLEVYEWSPVLVGMNPATALVGVKGLIGKAPLDEIVARVLQNIETLEGEAKATLDRREKEGRVLSTANVAALESFAARITESADGIRSLVQRAKRPERGADAAAAKDAISMAAALKAQFDFITA